MIRLIAFVLGLRAALLVSANSEGYTTGNNQSNSPNSVTKLTTLSQAYSRLTVSPPARPDVTALATLSCFTSGARAGCDFPP